MLGFGGFLGEFYNMRIDGMGEDAIRLEASGVNGMQLTQFRPQLARISHKSPATTPYSTIIAGRIVNSPHYSMFIRFLRRFTNSPCADSTLRRFTTKICEISGLAPIRKGILHQNAQISEIVLFVLLHVLLHADLF